MRRGLGLVGLALAVMVFAPPAQAAPIITGSISFSGAAQPMGGTNWFNATGFDFLATTAMVQSSPVPSGTYLGTQGSAVSFSDFTFAPFPAGGVVPLWTFTNGGITYSFSYLTLGSLFQVGNDTSSSISLLNGTGILFATGFAPTAGLFSLTAQGFGAVGGERSTFSFSSSNVATDAPIPEPSSMLLLGTGLAGLRAWRKRRQ